MRTTPATPLATANHTRPGGGSPRSGQDRRATQIGNVFVSVRTSETGSRVSAKNVPIRLKLPATLRIHSARGRQRTSCAPALKARMPAKRNANELRASARVGQSQEDPSA